MRKSWLLCVLMGTLAWGQAPPAAPPAQAGAAQTPPAASKPEDTAAQVPENAVVLTIKGVCPAAPKAAGAAGSKTAAGSTKKPADCKTEITRAEFEKIASGLSPNVTPQLKRQLEQALPRFIAMSEKAKEKGLDKTPRFQQTLKIAKMQILTTELQRSVQEDADKIPDSQVAAYYKEQPEAYEQYSLDRLFVPRYKQAEADAEDTKDPDKMTEEQQKAKEAADKEKQEKGEQELTKLADTLRERAAAGEDFAKLQKEAFEAAGTKVDNPTVNLPKVRRTGLPPTHTEVFDLKQGEVSKVISDNGGHYIYKVVSKEVLPLDQVKEEIHNKLKSERTKKVMDEYTNSFQAVPNEAYFGPAPPPGPGGMGIRPGMPPRRPMAPPQAQPQSNAPAANPPAGNPPAQPPATQAPPSKPN
jgi:bifunctional DNA-binding transcriptional regulator/antitoxin component of YhaV-PrlF toxin-antitoxin module